MTAMLVAYLVVAVGVALWFVFPPERAHGTAPRQALASGALWPLLVLCLVAFAVLCRARPEAEPRRDGSPAGLDAP